MERRRDGVERPLGGPPRWLANAQRNPLDLEVVAQRSRFGDELREGGATKAPPPVTSGAVPWRMGVLGEPIAERLSGLVLTSGQRRRCGTPIPHGGGPRSSIPAAVV